MRVSRVLMLLVCIVFMGNLAAQQASPGALPASVAKFVEGWNMKSYQIAEAAFSPRFAIQNVPSEYNAMALEMIFSKAPIAFSDCVFKEMRENTCIVALVTENGSRDVEFELDEDGLIVSTSLFTTANPGPSASNAARMSGYAEIPFELVQNLIILKAVVDGVEGDFILDCGAPMLVLNSKPDEDGSRQVAGLTMGVGGAAEAPGVRHLGSFAWGGGSFADFDCVTMDLSHLATELGRPFMGLIGKAELEPFECYFDYSRKLIILYALDGEGHRIGPERPPAASTKIRFNLSAHIPVVRAEVHGIPLRMGLDTGAQANLLALGKLAIFRDLLTDAATDTLMGADLNQSLVTTGTIVQNTVSGREFPNMAYAFSDISQLTEGYNIAIDGLLGYPFLSQRPFSLNYRRKVLAIF